MSNESDSNNSQQQPKQKRVIGLRIVSEDQAKYLRSE
jgi:hypothetical protein